MAQTNDQFPQLDHLLHVLPFAYHVTNASRATDCPVHESGATHSLNITSNSRKAPMPSGYASSHLVPYHLWDCAGIRMAKASKFLACQWVQHHPASSKYWPPSFIPRSLYISQAPLFVSTCDLFVIVTLQHFWQHRNFADILYCSCWLTTRSPKPHSLKWGASRAVIETAHCNGTSLH